VFSKDNGRLGVAIKKTIQNTHAPLAKGRKAAIRLAMSISHKYSIVVVIGGCVTREGDYNLPNAKVVYVSPNMAIHD